MSNHSTPLIGGNEGSQPIPDAILRMLVIVVNDTDYTEQILKVPAQVENRTFHCKINGEAVHLPMSALGQPHIAWFEDGEWEGQVFALEQVETYRDVLKAALAKAFEDRLTYIKECQKRLTECRSKDSSTPPTTPLPPKMA